MCIIISDEEMAAYERWLKVTKTRIYAAHTRPGIQATVYSMSVASPTATAMILPVPVVPGSGEDALRFIDLSEYPLFFDDLNSACWPEYLELAEVSMDDEMAAADAGGEEAAPLVVHEVGDYEASYVPSRQDFNRIDARFQLPEALWKVLPDYGDWGFAVFQLKIPTARNAATHETPVHPMAFEFSSRDKERLFYPTVHVHDGAFHNEAGYYHTFYCQRFNARNEFKYQRDLFDGQQPTRAEKIDPHRSSFKGYPWFCASEGPVGLLLDWKKSQGLIDPDKSLFAMDLMGDYPNKDMWLGDAIPEITREDIERQYMEAFKEYEPCEEPDPFEADIDEDELVDDAFDFLFGEDPNERVRDKEKDPKD